ncbi:MAG: hypothetical protein JRI98_14075, partial [Deltaproteobacteria bacterium]|nr:hypothetical protein [Deltaproteobacteria bacterium]
MPKLYGEEDAPHMQLLGAASAPPVVQVPQVRVETSDPLATLLAAEPALGTDPIVTAAAEAARSQTAPPAEPSVRMLH